MAYRSNPFLGRMSESTTSDQEFVQLFSPKVLEHLPKGAFYGAVHIFRSPPGGGKTTLLRAFTPRALSAIWNTRQDKLDEKETYQKLLELNIFDVNNGPQLLGVLLTCASGYADLPHGASIEQYGLFRALLNCRIVLRALRNLALLQGYDSIEQLSNIQLKYSDNSKDLKSIPLNLNPIELIKWAELKERKVYAQLDSISSNSESQMPTDVQFEGVIWLQDVKFLKGADEIAPMRLLMIDDLHKLRQKQRELLIDELTVIRSTTPIWLAERNIALREKLLSQGGREGRDINEYSLDEFWNGTKSNHQFITYAQNILERRLHAQSSIPFSKFSTYLRSQFHPNEYKDEIKKCIVNYFIEMEKYTNVEQYSIWLEKAKSIAVNIDFETLKELYTIRILIFRNEGSRQLTFDLAPLPTEEINKRDSSSISNAAEIFIHKEIKIPYYYGIEKLCKLSTNNVEELLSLSAELYEALVAKKALRKTDLILSPKEQEKHIKHIAKQKRDLIPNYHTEGNRAQKMLDSIGFFCRSKTFLPNAPYAPGVTGVRLSQAELNKLHKNKGSLSDSCYILRKVLSECVAENLLVSKFSSSSTSRDSGTVFYLNRTLCAHYNLPLQKGGWQDVRIEDMIDWMERGSRPQKTKNIGI